MVKITGKSTQMCIFPCQTEIDSVPVLPSGVLRLVLGPWSHYISFDLVVQLENRSATIIRSVFILWMEARVVHFLSL